MKHAVTFTRAWQTFPQQIQKRKSLQFFLLGRPCAQHCDVRISLVPSEVVPSWIKRMVGGKHCCLYKCLSGLLNQIGEHSENVKF